MCVCDCCDVLSKQCTYCTETPLKSKSQNQMALINRCAVIIWSWLQEGRGWDQSVYWGVSLIEYLFYQEAAGPQGDGMALWGWQERVYVIQQSHTKTQLRRRSCLCQLHTLILQRGLGNILNKWLFDRTENKANELRLLCDVRAAEGLIWPPVRRFSIADFLLRFLSLLNLFPTWVCII